MKQLQEGPPSGWERKRSSDEDSLSDLHLESDGVTANIPDEDASKSLLNSYNHEAQQSQKRQNTKFTTSWPILLIAIVVSLALGAVSSLAISRLFSPSRIPSHRNENTLASPSHDPSQHATFLQTAPCGNTPAEARAAGCIFDLISFNWLPPACHDETLSQDFEEELRVAGMLSWYEDMERTRPLTREQIMTGEYTGIYVSLGYHLRHCTAMWRRMHRALLEGGGGLSRVDSYIWSYHHTRHCENMLLTRYNESEFGEVFTTEVRIKYPDCGVVF